MDSVSTTDAGAMARRSPRRISITVSHALAERLELSALQQGRSLSNLCAYLLEIAAPMAS